MWGWWAHQVRAVGGGTADAAASFSGSDIVRPKERAQRSFKIDACTDALFCAPRGAARRGGAHRWSSFSMPAAEGPRRAEPQSIAGCGTRARENESGCGEREREAGAAA